MKIQFNLNSPYNQSKTNREVNFAKGHGCKAIEKLERGIDKKMQAYLS